MKYIFLDHMATSIFSSISLPDDPPSDSPSSPVLAAPHFFCFFLAEDDCCF